MQVHSQDDLSCPFAQTLSETDAEFYRTFPQPTNPHYPSPLVQTGWVFQDQVAQISNEEFFQGGGFRYNSEGHAISGVKQSFSSPPDLFHSISSCSTNDHGFISFSQHETEYSSSPPTSPHDSHHNYGYGYGYVNDATSSAFAGDGTVASAETLGHPDWAKQRSSGHNPAGLVDECQPDQLVVSARQSSPLRSQLTLPFYQPASISPEHSVHQISHTQIPLSLVAPVYQAKEEIVPVHMIVPSQQPCVDFKEEIRRLQLTNQQFESPISMHQPYQYSEPPYMDHLPYPDNVASPQSSHSSGEVHSPFSATSSSLFDVQFGCTQEEEQREHLFHMQLQVRDAEYSRNVDSDEISSAATDAWVTSRHEQPSISPVQVLHPPSNPEPLIKSEPPVPSASLPQPTPHRQVHSDPHKHQHQHQHSIRPMGWSPRRSPSPHAMNVSVRLSPLPSKRAVEKKPPLACLFCRGRKIACGSPLPGSKDKTCK